MKKQILFLAFFVLATLAGLTSTFAQNITGNVICATPTAVDPDCLGSDALHPMPGSPYMYTITVPNIVTGSGEYTWYVTQNQAFITAGVLNTASADTDPGTWVAGVGTGGGTYNNSVGGTDKIEITWNSFVHDPLNPVFVVIQVRGSNAADCPVNNLKVYVIEPVNAFTLDIAAVTDAPSGTDITLGATAESCFPDVVSAKYDVVNKEVDYNFGTSYLYFMVTAANFSDSWRPSFELSGLDVTANMQTATVEWAYSGAPTAWNSMIPPTGNYNGVWTTTGTVDAQVANGTVGTTGECILVKVTVNHDSYEGIAAEPITLAVDGQTQLGLATPFKDLHYADCSDDLFANDVVTHTIQPRPNIQDATPPATDDLLPIGDPTN